MSAAGSEFEARCESAAADRRLGAIIGSAVTRQYNGRIERLGELPDADALRTAAGQLRQHTIEHLDYYLEQLAANVRQRGGWVHFAQNADEAQRIVIQIAREADCRRVIKGKSMLSEEIGLNAAIAQAGMEVTETDLGQFVVQLGGERPGHILAPIVHKDRQSVGRLFAQRLGIEYSDDPRALTHAARAYLREKFRQADMGITGANFLIADTGQICVVENEGNIRQCLTRPRVLVSIGGIERVIPRMADLPLMLKLLARSATGQSTTVYTSIFGGPRLTGERDGPQAFHLVLVDNGRSELLAGEYREVLRCIRCGACLNACPVFAKVGGQAYGYSCSGPIGALLGPLMGGLSNFGELPYASTLCGACTDACPVKIDIPRHLLNLRRDFAGTGRLGQQDRRRLRLWAWCVGSPLRYRWAGRLARWLLRRRADNGFVVQLPKAMASWSQTRDLPQPAERTFHDLWAERARKRGGR